MGNDKAFLERHDRSRNLRQLGESIDDLGRRPRLFARLIEGLRKTLRLGSVSCGNGTRHCWRKRRFCRARSDLDKRRRVDGNRCSRRFFRDEGSSGCFWFGNRSGRRDAPSADGGKEGFGDFVGGSSRRFLFCEYRWNHGRRRNGPGWPGRLGRRDNGRWCWRRRCWSVEWNGSWRRRSQAASCEEFGNLFSNGC
jgi:hypothetical protein